MSDEKTYEDLINAISSNLGAFFRHLLPGILIVGIAYVSHREWFSKFDPASWSHILILSIVALAIGNIWFSVNRYAVINSLIGLCIS